MKHATKLDVQTLRAALAKVADPAKAGPMQAYMKSSMPYLGVSAVPLQKLCKVLFADLHWVDAAAWQADVLALWHEARFREERYAAIALTALRTARPFQRFAALGL